MFCTKCGEAIPDDSVVCPQCGENPREEDNQGGGQVEETVVYAAPEAVDVAPATGANKKIKPMSKKLWAILGGVVAVVALIFIVNAVQAASLKNVLMKEWYDTDGTILKVLEFDDDEAEYRLETGYGWMDTTLFSEEYKVVSGSSFKIRRFGDEWETYKVKFNDDKTVMTVSPAITSVDSSEKWYDLGD